jgi:hypothetical protein
MEPQLEEMALLLIFQPDYFRRQVTRSRVTVGLARNIKIAHIAVHNYCYTFKLRIYNAYVIGIDIL